MAKCKMNISVPDDLKKWLEDESERTGIPQSTLILIGLKTYVDQQRMLEFSSKMDLFEDLKVQLDNLKQGNIQV